MAGEEGIVRMLAWRSGGSEWTPNSAAVRNGTLADLKMDR